VAKRQAVGETSATGMMSTEPATAAAAAPRSSTPGAMSSAAIEIVATVGAPAEATARRTRMSRKRRLAVVPRMPLPVRGLWEAASQEEQQRAHRAASVLLQVWLGRMRRSEAAAQLELSPLRVWQLSQQAVAGMVAGLLKQPRRRVKGGLSMALGGAAAEEDPRRLRKEVEELRRKLKLAEDVIALLREFPAQRTRAHEPGEARATPVKSKVAGTDGEEKRSIPERVKRRSGMRKPTAPGSTTANPELADGAGTHPAP